MNVAGHPVGFFEVTDAGSHPRRQAVERILLWTAHGLAREVLDLDHGSGCALPSTIRLATAYLKDHYTETVSLHQVATVAGLSRERLSRLFHRSLGISFSAYLNELRLNHARSQLRETDHTVADIAFAAGFQSLSQFNRRFRQAEGVSPRTYRQNRFQALSA
ncbi:MAG: helix-turn-helix transcriptional regulator [Opitutales bacterium]